MIKNNVLGKRLNQFREGTIEETPPKKEIKIPETFTKLAAFLLNIFGLGIVFVRSLAYGFALKTIFTTDWNFLAFFAVGLSLELITSNILDLFKK